VACWRWRAGSIDEAAAGHAAAGPEDEITDAGILSGGSVLMLSDGHCAGQPKFAGSALSIAAADAAHAERLFDALAEGGKVQMPLAKTFWSPAFGKLTDRFRVGWVVNVAA
jgi:PhnB protein